MLCRIADLFVEVPAAGGMDVRCKDYLTDSDATPDIVIKEESYSIDKWGDLPREHLEYMDSGNTFYFNLLKHSGMLLHSSAVELDGEAYLFSGPCGMGKSTHTGIWKEVFPSARVFNDDKPALRFIDGVWYAYGTPWCGKDGININLKVPLKAICFLRRGSENKIRRLSKIEAAAAIFSQTTNRFGSERGLDYLTDMIDKLVCNVPVYELANRPEPEAAILSHGVMSGAESEM